MSHRPLTRTRVTILDTETRARTYPETFDAGESRVNFPDKLDYIFMLRTNQRCKSFEGIYFVDILYAGCNV